MNININDHKENSDIPDRLVNALKGNNKIEQISQKFMLLSTVEKIDFASDLLNKFDLLPKLVRDGKDNVKSNEIRKEGNQLFCSKREENALEMYTYSVAVAESDSENLGLAYANRSAVLFKLKLFDECLKDIQRALQNKYPDHLKPKLLERQKNAEDLKKNVMEYLYHQPIPIIIEANKNSLIECASNSVEIKYDEECGRHIIATKDIRVGEVIAVEEAAFTLLTDKKWCHCHHCLALCYNLIPCNSCTQALFCSEKCKENSRTYHEVECPILVTIQTLDFNSCRILPIRIAVLMRDIYENLEEEVIMKPNEGYRSGRYKEIHNLVTNEKRRIPANLFERVTATSLFFHLVEKYTNFFEDSKPEVVDIFKTLVLRHLQTMACNFHQIYELGKSSPFAIYNSEPIASGAYSFLSLFNHSCSPNVTRTSYGSTIVLTAIQTIPNGSQLFDDYGYHYGIYNKQIRQAGLKKQYFFDCHCLACENDWSTYGTLPKLNSNLSTTLMKNYNKLAAADLETAKKIETLINKAAVHLEAYIPCKDFCEVQELMKQILCIMGNTRRSFHNT